MVTLPKDFVATKYPGYFWNVVDKKLYSLKVTGELKHGGGGGHFWYSWMPEKYDETCNSVEEILDHLGFDFQRTTEGILITGYYRKMGQEDLFFQRISHLIEGEISWIGEDDETWTWLFDGVPQPKLITQ